MNVNASEFGIQSELELVIASLKKTLDYYTDKLEKVLNEDGERGVYPISQRGGNSDSGLSGWARRAGQAGGERKNIERPSDMKRQWSGRKQILIHAFSLFMKNLKISVRMILNFQRNICGLHNKRGELI